MSAEGEAYSRSHVYAPICSVCRRESSDFKLRRDTIFCIRCDPATKAVREEVRELDEEYNKKLRLQYGLR